ncbi:hypothetical protein IWQ61_009493 [Dispira simplex]|nr:hypothetical protein IWQ61_009493 [Dispira simplex]
MENEAQSRQERLRQLAQVKEQSHETTASETPPTKSNEPVIRFRNYTPSDAISQKTEDKTKLANDTSQDDQQTLETKRPTLGKRIGDHLESNIVLPRPTGLNAESTVEKTVAGITNITLTANEALRQKNQVDLQSLAPRKPNWDLKRDLQKKLDRLEDATQSALAELIRRRVQAEQTDNQQDEATDQVDLADAVRAQERIHQSQRRRDSDDGASD